jgi:hypothetical protein
LPDTETDVSFEKLFWQDFVSPSLVTADQFVFIVTLLESVAMVRSSERL